MHSGHCLWSLLVLIGILAPLLGGVMMTAIGWRSIFWFLTAVSFLTFLSVHFFLKETSTPHPDHKLTKVLHNYLEVFKDRQFTGYAFSLSFIYAGMFAYITGSPFVFIEHFKLTTSEYSILFGVNASGLILFSQVNTRLLKKYTPAELIKVTLPVTLAAGLLLMIVGLSNGPVWSVCLPLFLFILTMGIIAPNAAACALAHQKKSAGSASALMGTIQFSVSALCSTLVSGLHDGSIVPMTSVMFVSAFAAFFFHWLLIQSKDEKLQALKN
jgi:DHA1 family bicyclomycin/chloramphenicol resistance-like MFS transporter